MRDFKTRHFGVHVKATALATAQQQQQCGCSAADGNARLLLRTGVGGCGGLCGAKMLKQAGGGKTDSVSQDATAPRDMIYLFLSAPFKKQFVLVHTHTSACLRLVTLLSST